MKNAQKNYLDRRLNEVKGELITKLKAIYNIQEYVSVESRLQLILDGGVGINTRKVKDMLQASKLGHGCWAQWQEVFDFSAQEKEVTEKSAPLNKAIQLLETIFQNAKDRVMLGSESEALETLKELQSLNVAALAKQFPPVVETKKKKTAKKKAK